MAKINLTGGYKKAKGSKGVSGVPGGVSANKAKGAARKSADPFDGKMDSRPESSDRVQSARS